MQGLVTLQSQIRLMRPAGSLDLPAIYILGANGENRTPTPLGTSFLDWRGYQLRHTCKSLVPQPGIEPSFDAYKATVIPIYYKGKNSWCEVRESNPCLNFGKV